MKKLRNITSYFYSSYSGWLLLLLSAVAGGRTQEDTTRAAASAFSSFIVVSSSSTSRRNNNFGHNIPKKEKNHINSCIACCCGDEYFMYSTMQRVGTGAAALGRSYQQKSRQLSRRCLSHCPQEELTIRNSQLSTNLISNTAITSTSSNGTWVHIGNINWYMECDDVKRYLMCNLFENLSIVGFHLKPKSNKPRDDDKFHGGSVKIEFETNDHARQAMERLLKFRDEQQQEQQQLDQQCDSGSNSSLIGLLRFHWMVPTTQHNDSDIEDNTMNPQNQKITTLERIQHRKNRAEKYARQRLRRGHETDALLQILEPLWEIKPCTVMDELDAPELDWDSVPFVIDPIRGGGLRHGTLRGGRKQAQVEAILFVLRILLQDHHVDDKMVDEKLDNNQSPRKIAIADLASGAGNLSLPIAWFLKDIHATVLAVDINPWALQRLSERAQDVGVDVQTLVQDLEELSSVEMNRGEATIDYLTSHNCQAIVSLHGCGAVSDLAIEAAVARDLPFVVSPCCIAKANQVREAGSSINMRNEDSVPNLISSQRSGAPLRISYPRSKQLETFCMEHSVLNDYPLIMTAADYSMGGDSDKKHIHQQRGKMSKLIVELDRLKWAEERGYYTRIMNIPRLGTYPKKELLLGAKRGSTAAERLSRLPPRVCIRIITQENLKSHQL
mmetsp:Transcript_16588/g.31425  ORF Transcript_16588/g.31425 Transcript_16588/m.31425 type:complete len:669 (+) Transcript_16588:40-2046(+)